MHNICIDGNLRLLYNLAAQQQYRNLAKNMIIKLEIYMTGTEESMKKNKSKRGSRIRSQRDSFKRSTKIIQISSGKMRKTKQQRGRRIGRVGERKQSNHHTTRGNNKWTDNVASESEEKKQKQMKWKWRSEGKTAVAAAQAASPRPNQVEPSEKGSRLRGASRWAS